MNITYIISTADPINGVYITDLNYRSQIVEGDKANDLTNYSENCVTSQIGFDTPVKLPERDLSKTLSNSTDDYSS